MRRFFTTELAVGVFALLGFLIIIYMSLQVNDRSVVGRAARRYHAYFESVSGLVRKVPVEISGIPAGYVQAIELIGGKARVTIRVRQDVPVYANASLGIRDRGLLGDRFLFLNPGSSEAPQLPDGGEIPRTFAQGDYERLTQSLADAAETIKDIVKSENPQGALGRVIANLRDTTERIKEVVGDNQEHINRILTNLDSFTGDLREITGRNKEEIGTVIASLEDTLDSLKRSLGKEGGLARGLENFERTMASVQRITEKIEKGEGTIGKLVYDETTVDNLNDTMESVNETLGLFRKIQLGIRYRGEWLTSVSELQNLVGITAAPSPDQYLLLEFVDAPVGVTRTVDTTVTSGGNVLSNTQTVQTNDSLQITFLLAKRFWDLTLRFGLLRSKGGAALDYSLLKDKLVLSVEAFDFSRPGSELHLRAFATVVLYRHLLLTGGVDDILPPAGSGRNAFFGAGIQFTDNDLKALITAVPAKF